MILRQEKPLVPAGIWTPVCLPCSRVTTSTALCCLCGMR